MSKSDTSLLPSLAFSSSLSLSPLSFHKLDLGVNKIKFSAFHHQNFSKETKNEISKIEMEARHQPYAISHLKSTFCHIFAWTV